MNRQDNQMISTNQSVRQGWSDRADELAQWVMDHLVVRHDVWGGYYQKQDAGGRWVTCQTTHPRKVDRGCRFLSLGDLTRHFCAASTCDVVGLHTTSPENLSRWGAVDIDHHGDQSPDPAKNLAAALAWYGRLKELGFTPLLTASNGAGGYHLRILLCDPVATPRVFAFMRWLVRNHADYGLTALPETFPKQPMIGPGKCGNWLRLPGRHHTRPYISKIWDGTRWLAGAEAVVHILGLNGDSPSLLPADLVVPSPQPVPSPRPRLAPTTAPKTSIFDRVYAAGPYRSTSLDRRIAGFMRRMPNLGEGQGRDIAAYKFACWLVRDMDLDDATALEWLCTWDRGNCPPKGREVLAEILANAHQYAQRPVGCGLHRQPLRRRRVRGHVVYDLSFTITIETEG